MIKFSPIVMVVGLALASVLATQAGCVSQTEYDAKVGELDQAKADLQAAEEAKDEADKKIQSLEETNTELEIKARKTCLREPGQFLERQLRRFSLPAGQTHPGV